VHLFPYRHSSIPQIPRCAHWTSGESGTKNMPRSHYHFLPPPTWQYRQGLTVDFFVVHPTTGNCHVRSKPVIARFKQVNTSLGIGHKPEAYCPNATMIGAPVKGGNPMNGIRTKRSLSVRHHITSKHLPASVFRNRWFGPTSTWSHTRQAGNQPSGRFRLGN